jgi:hypothetical protein
MLSYVVSGELSSAVLHVLLTLSTATTSYLRPVAPPLPSYDLATRPLSIQDDLNIPTFEPVPSSSPQHTIIDIVLRENNLYSILGVPLYTSSTTALRRAYLSRSRTCHPECVSPIIRV